MQPPFRQSHYLNGFSRPDGKLGFKPDWDDVPFRSPFKRRSRKCRRYRITGLRSNGRMKSIRSGLRPRRRAAFLTQPSAEPDLACPGQRTTVMIHPDDARACEITDGDYVVLGNKRGEVRLHAKLFAGMRHGVPLRNRSRRTRPLPMAAYQYAHGRRPDCALWRRRFHGSKISIRRARAD